jgi:hypothetical protein
MVTSSPVASVHVPTGLKLILRWLGDGLASLLHGSISSTAVRRCDNDILSYCHCERHTRSLQYYRSAKMW